ncbi:hypothetical protein FLAG1_11538 [Fusarium langsethiae]|uniref:C2H2-type domain-containing protein n=1 Tax=Fusarium langsethiae TaxID=179993 RepID=A0A0M9EMK8_FUSLA|nr:hypothetical protein FLAG1_11538 [Fusarium langsethiae]
MDSETYPVLCKKCHKTFHDPLAVEEHSAQIGHTDYDPTEEEENSIPLALGKTSDQPAIQDAAMSYPNQMKVTNSMKPGMPGVHEYAQKAVAGPSGQQKGSKKPGSGRKLLENTLRAKEDRIKRMTEMLHAMEASQSDSDMSFAHETSPPERTNPNQAPITAPVEPTKDGEMNMQLRIITGKGSTIWNRSFNGEKTLRSVVDAIRDELEVVVTVFMPTDKPQNVRGEQDFDLPLMKTGFGDKEVMVLATRPVASRPFEKD